MNLWHDIAPARVRPEDFFAVIEIEKGSKNKYEMDKETGALRLDRILYTSTHYPANYGFIPRTWADDGDPLDVLVLCSESIRPMSLVRCFPIGVITMEDLLESIVGNMQDEYDQEEEEYQKLSDTIFVLDGSMSVDDVEELLGMNIGPEEDYDTLSGMITDLLDCIPAKDEHPSVQVGNVKFTVLATDERRIAKLRAEILPVPEQTDEE